LRVVAGVYALFGIACLLWIAIAWRMASATSLPLTDQAREFWASGIPSMAVRAVGSFVLSGLSARLLTLRRLWQLVAAVGSLLFAIPIVVGGLRAAAFEIQAYTDLGKGYSYLAILLGTQLGLVLVSSLCSFVIWRQVRASNNRWRGP